MESEVKFPATVATCEEAFNQGVIGVETACMMAQEEANALWGYRSTKVRRLGMVREALH